MTGLPDHLWIALAALIAGLVNALAGGGSLISFPALTAVGVPALTANVTNSLALTPGYLGAARAQRRQLAGQGRRLALLLPPSLLGGVLGALLLLASGEVLFRRLVPWLILSGSLLLALQEPLRAWILRRRSQPDPGASGDAGEPGAGGASERAVVLPVFAAALYGGYFGAGLGVILLAVLAVLLDDDLIRLNGLKQVISLAVNLAAALVFLLIAPVDWPALLTMAAAALAGGLLGGRIADRIDPDRLRTLVVLVGLVVGLTFLLQG